jgi:hypothetical protein
MNHRLSLFILATMTMMLVVACGNKIIEGNDFTKMTIYKNRDEIGPYVITDQKVISQYIQKINSAPREDISKIVFERGPDGRIIFEGGDTVYEVQVFSDGGNVVTDRYYIQTDINLDDIKTKE